MNQKIVLVSNTRISKLRKKAATMGYDPNRWFDNVEVLFAREVGREPINYVTNILKNYIVYKSMKEWFESRKESLEKFKAN
jgi:membrane-bound lytic murein transglycosylase MltF